MLKTNATWHLLRLRSGQTCLKIAEFLCVYASPRKCFATGLFSLGLIGLLRVCFAVKLFQSVGKNNAHRAGKKAFWF